MAKPKQETAASVTPGARFRAVRRALGLSQKEFAVRLNVSQSTLSQIENGYYHLSFTTLNRLLLTCDVDANWLVTGIGEMFRTRASELQADPIPIIYSANLEAYATHHTDAAWLSQQPTVVLPARYAASSPGITRVFELAWDSMEPKFEPLDFIVAEHVRGVELHVGSTLLCLLKERYIFRRLKAYDLNTGTLTLSSELERLRDQMIQENEVLEAWVVRARLTTDVREDGLATHRRISELEAAYTEIKSKLSAISATTLANQPYSR